MGELARGGLFGGAAPIKNFINGIASGSSEPTGNFYISFPESADGDWYGVFQIHNYTEPATHPYALVQVTLGPNDTFSYKVLYSDPTFGTISLLAPTDNSSANTKGCRINCSAMSGYQYYNSYSFKFK